MPTERGSEGEADPGAAFDELLRVLSEQERRAVVRLLRERDRLAVETLVSELREQLDAHAEPEAVRERLREEHLPWLAETGLVTVETAAEETVVELDSLSNAAATVLDIDPAERTTLPAETVDSLPPDDEGRSSAVQQLQEQRRMFSTLVSNLPGMVYRCANERGWPMSFVSEGCRELTGHDPGALEQGTVSWGTDVVAPADREGLWEEIQASLAEREQFAVTYRIRRADGTERWVWEQGRGIYEDGEVTALEGFITDVTEQRRRERRLEAVFDGTFQFMGLLEPDGTVLEVNRAALEFADVEREAVVGERGWETPWWTDDEPSERFRSAVETAADGEFVRYEETIRGAEHTATVDLSVRPVTDGDAVELLVAEGRDITERVRREEQLEALDTVSTDLVAAESTTTVCDVAVAAAEETLGLALASVELYDAEAGRLKPAARTDAVSELVGDESLFDAEAGESWEVFVEQDGTVYRDVAARSGVPDTGTVLDSAMVLPLGSHGVFIAGATEPEAFGETEVDLARALATNVEASLDVLARETELRERGDSLARKNERLNRLNQLNEVIRDLLQSLLGAASRAEIQRTACESLAGAGPYRFAWLGRLDPASGTVRPEARAGAEEGYLDAVTVATDDPDADPAAKALRERTVAVENRVRSDPPFEPWRRAATDRGFRSVVAVPLTYRDASYGVLAVYADEPDQFDALERSVLRELGDAIGYAITAVERKRALASDRAVELEFTLSEPDTPLFRTLRRVGGTFSFEGVVEGGGDSLSIFFTLEGATGLAEACEAEPDITGLTVVGEAEPGTRYECVLTGDGVLSTVFAHGGVPRDLTVGEETRLVVELPSGRDVREFTETVEERFPSASLVARRERDRAVQTAPGLRAALDEHLTERNLEVAERAYHSGFFEWPRENSGQEVADALDISQPTFNRHVRAAERALFEVLFEGPA
jgi:PAS domain S-box-containing protein